MSKKKTEIEYPAEPLRRYFEHLAGVLMSPEGFALSQEEHDALHEELTAAIDRINKLPVGSASALKARAAASVWLAAFDVMGSDQRGLIRGVAGALVPEFAAAVDAHIANTYAQIDEELATPKGRPN